MAAGLAGRDQAETLILGKQVSEPVTVLSLADARQAWKPITEILEIASRAGRERDFQTARRNYRAAMEHESFTWPAALQSHPDLDLQMAAAFILADDLESYLGLCQPKWHRQALIQIALQEARSLQSGLAP
jgi:hypothetical protein